MNCQAFSQNPRTRGKSNHHTSPSDMTVGLGWKMQDSWRCFNFPLLSEEKKSLVLFWLLSVGQNVICGYLGRFLIHAVAEAQKRRWSSKFDVAREIQRSTTHLAVLSKSCSARVRETGKIIITQLESLVSKEVVCVNKVSSACLFSRL